MDFADQRHRIDDDAVADHADFFPPQDATRDEVEHIFRGSEDDRMTGVVSPLGTDHDVGVLGEKIDYFALAFIAPLSADQDRICHEFERVI